MLATEICFGSCLPLWGWLLVVAIVWIIFSAFVSSVACIGGAGGTQNDAERLASLLRDNSRAEDDFFSD